MVATQSIPIKFSKWITKPKITGLKSLCHPIFGLTMTSRRFFTNHEVLAFVNNDLSIDTTFKTYKIKYLIDYICKRFRAVYVPKCELSIDETMLKAKGRFSISSTSKLNLLNGVSSCLLWLKVLLDMS